ncbi:MAG: pyridoxal-phosphate dependent enzyme [Myxococcales bacterium]|nr:pyridoxal-phosphate dependent enzyme [Myxococcales bacterium]
MTSWPIGSYPTPVERVLVGSGAGSGANALWIKRDDVTHADYGGNKVRKLEHVLQEAAQKGHRKLLTVGAAGSHHVLATALFGQRAGFEVHAVLVPQPKTPAGPTNLRAALAQGLRPHVASNWVTAGAKLAALRDDATTFVAVGGSDIPGTRGYVDAAHELARQVEAGELPEPSRIFVTLGSGGTAVGLALGLAQTKLKTRVVGVCIADPAAVIRKYARWLLGRVAALIAPDARGRASRRRRSSASPFRGTSSAKATGTRQTPARPRRAPRAASASRSIPRTRRNVSPRCCQPSKARSRRPLRPSRESRETRETGSRSFTGTRSRAHRSSRCSWARRRSFRPSSKGSFDEASPAVFDVRARAAPARGGRRAARDGLRRRREAPR